MNGALLLGAFFLIYLASRRRGAARWVLAVPALAVIGGMCFLAVLGAGGVMGWMR